MKKILSEKSDGFVKGYRQKLIWIMQKSLTLFLIIFLNLAAAAFSQTVTLKLGKVTIREALKEISNQTGVDFFYNDQILNVERTVTVDATDADILAMVSQLIGEDYEVVEERGGLILIKPVEEKQLTVDNITVQGTVTDPGGVPLAGVTILIEGTHNGTVSDIDGNFKLTVGEEENVLVFSYLGYKAQRVDISGQTTINVTMEEDFSQLDELVIIGYGEQKREEVSGAVSSIEPADVVQASTGAIGFDRSLGGLVKGVQVSQNTGRPGSPVRINIRGVTSPLSSVGGGLNQPLFVIDGVPFNIDALQGANPLLTLNPYDIESFDVLKDAAATSIYGSRGANGVIIITTKKGKRKQAPSVSVAYTTTIAKPINTLDVLDAQQYRDYYDLLISNSVEAMNAGQLDPFFSFDLANIADVNLDFGTFQVSYNGLDDDYFGDANTNWNDEVFRDRAVTNQANVNLSGGSISTNYALHVSFIDQEGLTIYDGLEQYTMGMSLETDITDYLKAGGTINLGHTKSKSGEDDLFGQYTINTSIARARPDLAVRDDNGQLLPQPDYSFGFLTQEPNPLMRLQNKTTGKSYNFIGSSYIEVEPVKDLKLKADINAAVFYNTSGSFVPKIAQTDFVFFPNESFLSESEGTVSNITTNLTANYNFTLSDHQFGILLGAAWDRQKFNNSSQFYSGFPDDDVLTNASSAESVLSYNSNELESGINSMFSRLTYSYRSLYNATFNFRTDESSKFGPGNKRAYFPSLAVSWNISNENFLAGNDKVNTLKLRASVGRVGSTNVSDFAYLQFFETKSNDIYNGSSAVVPTNNFPNRDIGWETTEEVNVGLDFALLNARVRGGIDVYNRKTTGALVKTPVPLELGPSTYFSNFIDVTNNGVEVSLGGDIVRNENFTWTTKVNWAFNKNELVKLEGANINPFQLDYFVEGEPVGTIKGYRVAKIIQSQEEIDVLNADSPNGFYDQASTGVGDYLYEDIDGDGEITSDDRTIIGDIQPDYFGGLSNTFTYKNLSLTALFQYSVGAETIWSSIPFSTVNFLGENKYSEYALNTWTPENTDARYARALYFDPSASGRTSDRYLFSTSYLRLKSVQFSYSLDKNILDKIGIVDARLILAASNLITWTNWPGLDPETFSERGGIIDQTNNEDPYPLAKSFSLGVQIQF